MGDPARPVPQFLARSAERARGLGGAAICPNEVLQGLNERDVAACIHVAGVVPSGLPARKRELAPHRPGEGEGGWFPTP